MRGFRLMQAISHSPSGDQAMHKESHSDSNSCEPWYCSAVYIMTPLHLIPLVSYSPRRSSTAGGNANEFCQLISAQTHRGRIGGLWFRVLFQSTTTTRPSKHTESFYSLTVLPPVTTSLKAVVFCPCPRSGGNSEWGGTTTSFKHRRRKPPSCLIDFVFST